MINKNGSKSKILSILVVFSLILISFSIYSPKKAEATWFTYKGNGANSVFVRDVQVNYSISMVYSENLNKLSGTSWKISGKESSVSIGSNQFLRYSDIAALWQSQHYSSNGEKFSYNLKTPITNAIGDAKKLNYFMSNSQTVYVNSSYTGRHQADIMFSSGFNRSHWFNWDY
ncbi:hypothetical protein [Bacillus sp. AK031]